MTSFEMIIRTIACTASVILAFALSRAATAGIATRLFGTALCLGVVGYILCSGSAAVCSSAWSIPAQLLAAAIPFLFWAWTGSIMNDDFALSPLAIAGGVLLSMPVVANQYSDLPVHGVVVIFHSVLGLMFVASVLVNVVRGWREDLVESRRRLRFIIVAISSIYIVVILTVELFLRTSRPHDMLLLLNAMFLMVLMLGITTCVLEVSAAARASFGWSSSARLIEVEPAVVAVRDREQELIARLNQLMTTNAAYRDSTVTIATLASRLGVTEKKLRETINRRLGFKNYASFVNAFRVEEVRQRLSDPKQDDTPILSMALEAGFGSIVAFNRAFKERHGITPSLYRAHRSVPSESTAASDLPIA